MERMDGRTHTSPCPLFVTRPSFRLCLFLPFAASRSDLLLTVFMLISVKEMRGEMKLSRNVTCGQDVGRNDDAPHFACTECPNQQILLIASTSSPRLASDTVSNSHFGEADNRHSRPFSSHAGDCLQFH